MWCAQFYLFNFIYGIKSAKILIRIILTEQNFTKVWYRMLFEWHNCQALNSSQTVWKVSENTSGYFVCLPNESTRKVSRGSVAFLHLFSRFSSHQYHHHHVTKTIRLHCILSNFPYTFHVHHIKCTNFSHLLFREMDKLSTFISTRTPSESEKI